MSQLQMHQQLLTDYQNFKTHYQTASWMGDFQVCQFESKMIKSGLKNDQAWAELADLEPEGLKPAQGYLTLASSVQVFNSFEEFEEIKEKNLPIINAEFVDQTGQNTYQLLATVQGLQVFKLTQQTGDEHLVRQQTVQLKSKTHPNGGQACYAVYYQINQNLDQLSQPVASRFMGFGVCKGEK